MFNKKYIIILLMILCLSAISSVSANDLNDNMTLAEDNGIDNSGLIGISVDNSKLNDNNKVIYFDASASSNGDGSKSNPYKYVNQNTLSGNDITAYFSDGIYSLNTPFKISSNMTLIGESTEKTIFNSILSNKYDFEIMDDSKLQIRNVTFNKANIQNHGTVEAYGVNFDKSSAFSGYNAPATYNTKEYGSSYGGVIICDPIDDSTPYVYLEKCVFNNTYAYSGGVISLKNSRLEVKKSKFFNSNAERKGGVIYSINSDITIESSDFNMNNASYGGTIYSQNSLLDLYKNNFYNSNADSFGGVIASKYSDINIDSCDFAFFYSLNDAGGAIYNFKGNVNIDSSYLRWGYAKFGGVIANLNGNLSANSSSFHNNYAEDMGGVIYNIYGKMNFYDDTFYVSYAYLGSAIYSESSDSLSLRENYFVNSTSDDDSGSSIVIDSSKDINLKNNHFEDSYQIYGEFINYENGKRVTFKSNPMKYILSNTGSYYDEYENIASGSNGNLKIYDTKNPAKSTIKGNYEDNFMIHFKVDGYNAPLKDAFFKIYIINSLGNIIVEDVIPVDEYEMDASIYFNKYMINTLINRYTVERANVPLINSSLSDLKNIPSSYDSRDYGYITPVKDQAEGGNCWAFAGIATLEACIKKITNITYDLSEENVKNVMASFSRAGMDLEPNSGGYDSMFMGYLTNWLGPTLEEYDAYDDLSSISVPFDAEFHVQNIYFLPEREKGVNDDLYKKAIMDYGAVSITIYIPNYYSTNLIGWDDNYNDFDSFGRYTEGAWMYKNIWNSEWKNNGIGYISYNTLYNETYKKVISDYGTVPVTFNSPDLHAVSIVGWNDNYNTYDSFGDYAKGAWIIKNSWGTDWEDNGFGYLSYDTPFVSDENDYAHAYTFIFNENDNYISNPIYCSGISDYIYSDGPIYCEIRVEAAYDEYKALLDDGFSAFATYFKAPTNYTVSVYKGNPHTNGKLILSQEGFSQAGYYTIPFKKKITFDLGDEIWIRIGYCNDGLNYLPIYLVDELSASKFYTNWSFVSFDEGKTFVDVTEYEGMIAEPAIQLFSPISDLYSAKLKVDVSKFNNLDIGEKITVNITLTDDKSTISQYFENDTIERIEGSFARVSINGKYYYARIHDGKASLTISFDKAGTYELKSEYKSNRYSSNIAAFNFTVNKMNTKTALSSNRNANNVILTATVNPSDATGNVAFNINGKDYTVKISGGKATYTLSNLKTGPYTVKATYKGDSDYKSSSSNTASFNIDAHYLNIKASDVTKNYGGSEKLMIAVTNQESKPVANIQLKIKIDGKTYTKTTDSNGKTSMDLDLKCANYTADIIFEGNDEYQKASITSKIIVNKLSTASSLSFNQIKNNMVTLTAKVNPSDATGNIVFNINGKDYTLKFSNGQATYILSDLNVGSYSVKATYNGDDIYKSSDSNTVKFNVKPHYLNIIAPDVTKTYGDDDKLVITLTDQDFNTISNAKLKITLGDKIYSLTTDSNGKVYVDLNLNYGTYEADIVFEGNYEYDRVSATSNVVIEKISTKTDIISTENGPNTYTIRADVDSPSATGDVVFTVNGKEYTVRITNGVASVKLSDLAAGSYVVKATYKGSTNYKTSTSNSISFKIEDVRINILAPDLTKYFKGAEKFVVTIKEDNKPLVNKEVIITLNGRPYTRITDENGQASMAINLNSGKYDVTTECDGIKFKSTITVKSTVSGNNITKIFRNGTQYYATFVDSSGNLLKNTDVNFNINGVFYTRTTNNNGVAKMNINLNPGTYILTATNPDSTEQYTNIVKVLPSIVENHDLTKYYRNASQYTLRLLDEKGNPMGAGVTIDLNINGVLYKRTSNATGYVNMNINLNPGTYIITAEYNGLRASNTIKVLPTIQTKDLYMKYRDGSKFEAKILDDKGKPYAGQSVTYNINGVFYNRISDDNGIARLNINLQAGQYIITTTFNGLNEANKVTISS